MVQQPKRIPRGLRNNNPLNIRKSPTKWRGKITPGSDRDFEQFNTLEHGLRAALIIIRTYISPKHNLHHVQDIIARWAPASENDVAAYTAFVCDKAQLTNDVFLYWWHRNFITRLVWAMAWYECGQKIPYDYFVSAYDTL